MSGDLENELINELGLCGCMESDDTLEHIRVTLSLMKRWSDLNANGSRLHDEELKRITTQIHEHVGLKSSPSLAYVYLSHLTELDVIEHGSSVRFSWLSQNGQRVLTTLEAWAAERALKKEAPR